MVSRRHRAILAAILAAAWTSGCLLEEDPELAAYEQAIVNGEPTAGDPAVTLLQTPIGACTGTMITRRVVLTARHCVLEETGTEAPASAIRAMWGPSAAEVEQSAEVVGYRYHPQADLALLHLARPAPVAPVAINQRILTDYVGQAVRLAGYGLTVAGDGGIKRTGVTALHALRDTRVGRALMVGAAPSGVKSCFGDSGGPAFMVLDGAEYQVGVISFGTGPCDSPDTLTGSVRVDVYAGWIASYVDEVDPGGLAPRSSAPQGPGLSPAQRVGGCSAAAGSAGGLMALLVLALARRRREAPCTARRPCRR